MKNYIYFDTDGKILRVSSQPPTGVLADEPESLEFDGNIDLTNSYVKNGTVVALPPNLDPNLTFNYKTLVWEDKRTTFEKENSAVTKRAYLLADSDWTDTLSAKARLGDELYNQWQTYRQALRDITDQPEYPNNIVWPVAPQ
jgi:hypothetical protein